MLAELQTPEIIQNCLPGQENRVRVDRYKGWAYDKVQQLYRDQEEQRKEDKRREEERIRKDRELEDELERKRIEADEERKRKDKEKQLAMRELHFQQRTQARIDKLRNTNRNQELGKNVIHDSFFDSFGKSCR